MTILSMKRHPNDVIYIHYTGTGGSSLYHKFVPKVGQPDNEYRNDIQIWAEMSGFLGTIPWPDLGKLWELGS